MMRAGVRRKLMTLLKNLEKEIADGLDYGIPHLVGEIRGDDVSLSVVVFENSEHRLIISEDEAVYFLFPTTDPNHRRLFFELWAFLEGKDRKNEFVPGVRIKGILRNALRREGFEVLWMNVRSAGEGEQVDVWAVKNGVRYNMIFEKISPSEYVLLEMEKV